MRIEYFECNFTIIRKKKGTRNDGTTGADLNAVSNLSSQDGGMPEEK